MPIAPQNVLAPQESFDSPKLIGEQLGQPGEVGGAIKLGEDQRVPL